MRLPKIKVERLYKQIAQALIEHIDSGAFKPGQTLPAERELAKQFGVSRTSVREALIFLEIEGRVDIRTGQGVYVRDPAAAPLPATQEADPHGAGAVELLAAREAVESRTAELAALNGSEDQRAALRRVTKEFDEYPVNNEAFLAQDKRFHLLIAEMTGNQVLKEVVEFLWDKRYGAMFKQLEANYAADELPLAMNKDHRQIAEAILAGDPAAAETRMRRHLQNVYARLFDKAGAGEG
ncbi:FadR/GntR family transcriptional regulator [Xanthobacter sp. VNH20]|uniref:FadR/GntR family transcriptional regulator n=1 Tax=Xanthobacter sp. VNH20 TaxID=3156616 RepID=UPI0032B5AF06